MAAHTHTQTTKPRLICAPTRVPGGRIKRTRSKKFLQIISSMRSGRTVAIGISEFGPVLSENFQIGIYTPRHATGECVICKSIDAFHRGRFTDTAQYMLFVIVKWTPAFHRASLIAAQTASSMETDAQAEPWSNGSSVSQPQLCCTMLITLIIFIHWN